MKSMLYFALLLSLIVSVQATHYEITTNIYTAGLTLQTDDSLYMTNGGFDSLTLRWDSTANVENTSMLEEGVGGIWFLSMWNSSQLDLSGGQIHQLDLNNDATAVLTGGLIESIYSYQAVNNPHITLYYSGDLPTVEDVGGFDFLVGNWGNGDPFNIYLHDTGYDVYGNFEFILIPEPMTLTLLACGGVLMRRRKR